MARSPEARTSLCNLALTKLRVNLSTTWESKSTIISAYFNFYLKDFAINTQFINNKKYILFQFFRFLSSTKPGLQAVPSVFFLDDFHGHNLTNSMMLPVAHAVFFSAALPWLSMWVTFRVSGGGGGA